MSIPDAAIAAGRGVIVTMFADVSPPLCWVDGEVWTRLARAVLEAASVEIFCPRYEGTSYIPSLSLAGHEPCPTCAGSGILRVLRDNEKP
jgi:hypothetical protein